MLGALDPTGPRATGSEIQYRKFWNVVTRRSTTVLFLMTGARCAATRTSIKENIMYILNNIRTQMIWSSLMVLSLAFCSEIATAQNSGGYIESGSHASPPSGSTTSLPSNGAAVRPGDIAATPETPASCTPLVLHFREELGLPPGGNIDAISSLCDIIPNGYGPALGGQLHADQVSLARYSVDPMSIGILDGAVRDEANGPDGAPGTGDEDGVASDVYEGSPYGTPVGLNFALYKDHECIYPLGSPVSAETDIDAIDRGKMNAPRPRDVLAWATAGSDPATFPSDRTYYPLVYSVDAPTAAAMGVSPADIFYLAGPGAIPIVVPAALLGLVPWDDIDGLAVDAEVDVTAEQKICFTLTRTSPTALFFFPTIGPMRGAGVFSLGLIDPSTPGAILLAIGFPFGLPAIAGLTGPIPWATATQMGLDDFDEMNALAIGDPSEAAVPNHPGTCEDLSMLTGVMGPLNDCDTKPAAAGDVLDVFVESPGGTFHWAPFLVAGQIFTTQPPASSVPGLHLSTYVDPQYGGAFILVDGVSGGGGLFGSPPLLPGGNFNSFQISDPAVAGVNIMIQSVVLSPSATNNFLATSNGHVLVM